MEAITGALSTFNPLIAILILGAYIVIDALYAKYTLDIANYNEYRAATVGSIIHFCIAFGVINYTENWLYIFPLAIGSWIGTFLMVKRERLKKKKN
jgi:hypothetical protein